jgi:prepilin-type N-terminal cleavage/methylation domain-containing protein
MVLHRRGFTLIELLVVIAIIAILVAMLLPAVQQVREAARKSQCQDHMHNLGIAIHNYEASHKMLPPATINPGAYNCNVNNVAGGGGNNIRNHTGYMLLLPFMEQKAIYDQIDFSIPTGLGAHTTGCTPHTLTALPAAQIAAKDHELDILRCPSDPPYNTPRSNATQPYHYERAHRTSYGFVTHQVENSTTSGNRYDMTYRALTHPEKSAWGHNGAAGMSDFQDGASNTILMMETPLRKHSDSYGPFWNQYAHTMYIIPARGINLVHVVSGVPDSLKRSYAWAAGSKHPGGAQAVMGDDVVKFLSENIDINIVRAVVSVGGGETTGPF